MIDVDFMENRIGEIDHGTKLEKDFNLKIQVC